MNKEKQINWYQSELTKDKQQLDRGKSKVIKELSGLSKEDILPKPIEKINIWQRLKKVILG
jgi:hypothetical protein